MKVTQYFTLTALSALALVLFVSCSGGDEQVQTERSVAVKGMVVAPGDHDVTLSYTGSLEGEQHANLYAKLSEAVERVPVREGQTVSANQIIVLLDKTGPSAQYDATRSVFLNAEKNLKKMESLYKEGAVSEAEFDGAKTSFDVARSNFDAVERLVEIRTPIQGVVTLIRVSPGDFVYAGQHLATVATTDRLRIKFGVRPEDVAFITKGASITISSEETAATANGTIVTAATSADPTTRTFQAEALIDNKDGAFRAGMFARVHILKEQLKAVLVVPRLAVLALGNEYVVFTVAGGIARRQSVQLGADLDGTVVVMSGLRAGDTLVTLGQNYLDDGFKVKLSGLEDANR